MSRFLAIFCLFLHNTAFALNFDVSADAALLINADTGAVLWEKQADELLYPASLTKIATTLYTLNRGQVSLDCIITAEGDALTPTTEAAKKRANYALPAHWLENDGGHMGLKKGEQMSLRDLLYGIMLPSANDAANVVAQYIGGSIPDFMTATNAYLREIGCRNTHFMNPHGLHHPDHVTTARDMATMACEGLKNPVFAEIVSSVRHTRPKTNLQEPTTLIHTNRLLRQGACYYSKAIGVKTGYHRRAQHNLVAAARDGDRTLLLVLMHSGRKEMFQEAKQVFETAFREQKVERTLLQSGPQPFALQLPGSRTAVESYLPSTVAYAYYPAEEPEIKAAIYWDDIALPVVKDQRLGEIRFFAQNERLLTTAPLYAMRDVRPSLISGISPWFALVPVLALGVFLWQRRRY